MGLIRAVYCRKGKDESGSARKPEIEFSNAAPSPMSCFFFGGRLARQLSLELSALLICLGEDCTYVCHVEWIRFFCFLFFQSIPLYERTASRWLALHIQQVPSLYGLVTRKSWKFCACTRTRWGLRKALPFLRVINTWRKSQDARMCFLFTRVLVIVKTAVDIYNWNANKSHKKGLRHEPALMEWKGKAAGCESAAGARTEVANPREQWARHR